MGNHVATHERSCDMLSFHQVGEQAFQNYVKYHILQYPSSAKVTLQQHKLMTIYGNEQNTENQEYS